jgi:tetrapyrrole methylase family protein / MazG family protein
MKSKMARITVVGIGPGPLAWLTMEAERELRLADKVFFRTCAYPAYYWLRELGKELVCFDRLYILPWPDAGEMYKFMTAALLKEADIRGHAVYAIPGSPFVLEDTVRLLKLQGATAGVEIRIIHGMSFLGPALSVINHDDTGLQIVLPRTHVQHGRFSPYLPLLVCQLEEPPLVMEWLLKTYPPNHAVTLIWTEGLPDYETRSKIIELRNLNQESGEAKYFESLYVPSLKLSIGIKDATKMKIWKRLLSAAKEGRLVTGALVRLRIVQRRRAGARPK